MTEPSAADLMAAIKAITEDMATMKADMALLKEKSESSAGGGGDRRADG